MNIRQSVTRAARSAAKRIVLFNHKGGVGKTMLTANLACALASQGKRVLMVDADPQSNLTSFFVSDDVVDRWLDGSDSPDGQTLWSALKPVVEATGDTKMVPGVELRTNVFLLPGDIRLAEFEEVLPTLWAECYQRKVRGFRGTAALSALVNDRSTQLGIDFVFYDCGPNIGALNRVVLLDADYFVVPAACDLFSLRAIKTLGHTLANWIRDWSTIEALAPKEFYTFPGSPKLMGFIPQRFRTYGDLPVDAHVRFISRIATAIHTEVRATLKMIDPDLVPFDDLKIGEVKDFSSLASRSQERGLPLWELSQATPAQRVDAHAAFAALAQTIIKRAAAP